MATLFEPPALLSIAVVLGSAAGAIYYGLRPALRARLPVVTDEKDEVWGTEDPPPPPKRRYVYPADRPIEVGAIEESLLPVTVAPAEIQPAAAEALDLDDELEEEEISLADLFRPKRRESPPPDQESPDAQTQD